ncbi:methyl-accepting chemotaxis sensory transducer [Comamonas thiooxydans]|uniref:methyl-accepting chemotaxis sensory transducer n=1 Tax=Comamonas thiooxydans TaxID=363952 RepID=UPI0001BB1922|nr:methyl-accepting chemotaxis sensory transducer [Comamonas thiooxydans]ACY34479.1 methyl-accepting chemotaxis sensory transduce [Comamonas thiooxydans]MDO1476855.1 hypothetical protein [Comamonas thiooxydans]
MLQLESAASEIALQVNTACKEISKTTKALGTSLQKVQTKSGEVEESMDSIMRMASQQQLILEAAEGQLGALEQVAENLTAFDKMLGTTLAQLAANNTTTEALTTQVAKLATESVDGRQAIAHSLTGVTAELAEYREAASQLVKQMAVTISSSERVAERIEDAAKSQVAVADHLRESAAMSVQVTTKYDQVSAEARVASTNLLVTIDERADKSLAKIGEAVQALQDVVRHVGDLSKSLRSHSDIAISTTEPIIDSHSDAMSPSSTAIELVRATPLVAHSPSSAMLEEGRAGIMVASHGTFGEPTVQSLSPAPVIRGNTQGTDAPVAFGAGLPVAFDGSQESRYPVAGSEQTPPPAKV